MKSYFASLSTGVTGTIRVVLVFAVLSVPNLAQVSVLTHHNDNARTGQNLQESYLTPATVNQAQFGELFSQPVDGMVIAQPLYVPNLQVNGATHNVVFVVTLHDGAYAFDADSNTGSNASPLWYTSFINPPNVTTVPGADQGCNPSNGLTEMGIMGTPVIDADTKTMYVVVKTLENGSYVFRLHALNITTGLDTLTPAVIQATYVSKGKTFTFTEQHRMQRPALLLANGVVYIAFGTMGCRGFPPSTGWMMAYDASNLQQLGVLDVGPTQSSVPGIWMGGDGPAVDSNGDVYLATGDGLFNYTVGGFDYGDTLMKVSLQDGSFSLVDYFTPYNQADLDVNDLDLGSSGPVLLPTQSGPYPNLAVIGGKEGTIYLVDTDTGSMGEYNSLADGVVQEVPFDPSTEIQIMGGATYWNNFLYFGSPHVPVEAFSLSDGILSTSSAMTTKQDYNFSSLFSISADGTDNGILWGVERKAGHSVLHAFNATNLEPLYSSTSRDPVAETAHLDVPTIADGKVYVGTNQNVVVMGLFNKLAKSDGAAQTGQVGTQLSNPLRVTATNVYTGKLMPGITIHFSDGGSGGSFSDPTLMTNSAGFASTSYTLPGSAGMYTITASSPGFTTAYWNETATAAENIAGR